ncbi:MAG: HEAT repeat domain-containing protein, partial [Candidatus Omnitrophota bacterium]
MNKKIIAIALILAFGSNQLVGLSPAYSDTLRPMASKKSTVLDALTESSSDSPRHNSGNSHALIDRILGRMKEDNPKSLKNTINLLDKINTKEARFYSYLMQGEYLRAAQLEGSFDLCLDAIRRKFFRIPVILVLREIEDPRAVDILIELLGLDYNIEEDIYEYVATADLEKQSFYILQALDNKVDARAAFYCYLLRKQYDLVFKVPDAIKMAMKALSHKNPNIQTAAINVLSRFNHERVIELILDMPLYGQYLFVYKVAVKAVAKIKHYKEYKGNIEDLNDRTYLRLGAGDLAETGDFRAARIIIGALGEYHRDYEESVSLRRAPGSLGEHFHLTDIDGWMVNLADIISVPVPHRDKRDKRVSDALLDAVATLLLKNEGDKREEILKEMFPFFGLTDLSIIGDKALFDIEGGPGYPAPIKNLIAQIDKEAENLPEDSQEKFRRKMYLSIDRYMSSFGLLSKGKAKEAFSAYREILSLMNIVHDNLSLCLGSFVNLGLRAEDFRELRKALPMNNPLTRIIRILGEPQAVDIGGHHEVAVMVRDSGGFPELYNIIIDITKKRQRTAPQEVMGLLEILKHRDFRKWKKNTWKKLQGEIERYYAQGFKVISYNLFTYFVKHENDERFIANMKHDIELELGNIAWGGFSGLSDMFKRKYNISTEDELALLTKYMAITNLTAIDYAGKYEDVKQAY